MVRSSIRNIVLVMSLVLAATVLGSCATFKADESEAWQRLVGKWVVASAKGDSENTAFVFLPEGKVEFYVTKKGGDEFLQAISSAREATDTYLNLYSTWTKAGTGSQMGGVWKMPYERIDEQTLQIGWYDSTSKQPYYFWTLTKVE